MDFKSLLITLNVTLRGHLAGHLSTATGHLHPHSLVTHLPSADAQKINPTSVSPTMK